MDAASIPQQCATGAAECDAQRATLPPKKRPRLLHDCGSSAVQTAVMSAMSQPQASVMEASTAAPLEATLKRAESEASDSGASEGGQLRGSSYQEAWAGEAMQVQSSLIWCQVRLSKCTAGRQCEKCTMNFWDVDPTP